MEIQNAARKFAEAWREKGYERGESQLFWITLLEQVFGIDHPETFITFEQQVKLDHTAFIDGYIPSTHVMIEQKSIEKDLGLPIKQSDGKFLTPFQQAKRYASELPYSQRPRWIVTCNFREFWVYDMEQPHGEPQKILLENLENEFYRLQFLVDEQNERIRREEEISLKAGELVGQLYDALYKEYINPDSESLRSLNILCVRIVFCLYAEDAGLFETKTSFEDYIKSFTPDNLRDGIIKLFQALDTPIEQRNKYDFKLKPFPYVNGGLFHNEQIEIPNFTQDIVDVIVNQCAPFDWKEISPTIFGSVFESTLNPDTRRKGGMHYTSISNIHKVIDPLFMDDLETEFKSILETGRPLSLRERDKKLHLFQQKIGSLTFLDPACGSGNFLTETFISLRRLENKVISILNKGNKVLGFDDEFIKVSINQFYGIEINDFAVTVAMTALWIAECQMLEETEQILGMNLEFLPLKSHANIVEGNALRMDWSTLGKEDPLGFLYTDKLNLYRNDDEFSDKSVASESDFKYGKHYKELNVVAKDVEEKKLITKQQKRIVYDYIMGNPPFVGQKFQTTSQKSDLEYVFGDKHKGLKMLDYVAGWYKKTTKIIRDTNTHAAFVSTNSICQGESVEDLWAPLLKEGVHIDFAYRSFRWESESEQKAQVHCVIVGFSMGKEKKERVIFDNDTIIKAKNINGYLIDAPNVIVSRRGKQISNAPDMTKGAQLIDGGGFLLNSDEEKNAFIQKYPEAEPYIYRYYNAKDFLNNAPAKYCLYLRYCPPQLLKNCKGIYDRIQAVYNYRANSEAKSTQILKATPSLFFQSQVPEYQSIVIPVVSSENRQYIPMSFMPTGNVYTNALFYIDNANLYLFGILMSKVHMAWMRTVCGRLEMRYRYSNDIVYNNFPFPTPTDEQHIQITNTAQAIIDIREKYPNSSLADLYDILTMPTDLRKAHEVNDKAVMNAYGFDMSMSENEIVAELFKIYQTITKQ